MQLQVIAHALWSGNLAVLTLVPVEMLTAVPSYLVDIVAFRDDMRVLLYLHDVVGLNVSTPGAMYNAAWSGHVDIIRYLYELNHDTGVEWAVLASAQRGHVKAIEFFHANCPCNLGGALLCAIHREDFALAQLLLDLAGSGELDGSFAMFSAASDGRLESLKWLHQRGFANSVHAMDFAAKGGHLDVVQWLHANRAEGCTEAAMHEAAVQGHLAVVEWLFTNRHEGCRTTTLKNTTQNGHWHVVRFLIAHDIGTDDAQAAFEVAWKMKRAPFDVVALLKWAVDDSTGRHQKRRCMQQVGGDS